MSRRTAEANKAILGAWKREQEFVLKGQGTRDWTPQQQKDIISRKGKAYDDNGKAFEGHHMKSAEKYPEHQDDPANIQFLTKEEHFEAHDRDWKKPTNWYFDPIKKKKKNFYDKLFECHPIKLSNPIIKLKVPEEKNKKTIKDNNKPIKNNANIKKENIQKNNDKSFEKNVGNKLNNIRNWYKKHKKPIKIVGGCFVGIIGAFIGSDIADHLTSKSSDMDDNYNSIPESIAQTNSSSSNIDTLSDSAEKLNRVSPCEHEVSPHQQHYHTKDGVILKDKDSYHRGNNKD